VLIVQVDSLDPEPSEQAFGHLLDILRPAIQALRRPVAVRNEIEAKFGGDYDLAASLWLGGYKP
jgi:hypothetical protein